MIRLLLSIPLFLISLLIFIPAPTNFFWRFSVAITEYPHLFIGATLLLVISCLWPGRLRTVSLCISVATLLVFMVPVAAVYLRTSSLPDALSATFNRPAAVDRSPFNLGRMLIRPEVKRVPVESYTYKEGDSSGLSLDYYPTQGNTKRPCVVVVHSGAWSGGDKEEFQEMNYLLAEKGYNVAAINYRLAPQYQCPAQVSDVHNAINFLCSKSEGMKIDTSCFIILGRSAGGQIALLSAYTLNDRRVKGVIAFYAPADMVWAGTFLGNPRVMDSYKVLCEYLGGPVDKVPAHYAAASPLEKVNRSAPPTLLIHGRPDPMVSFEHSVRLHQKLDRLGITNYLLDLPFSTHACDYNLNGPSGQASAYAVLYFLDYASSPAVRNKALK